MKYLIGILTMGLLLIYCFQVSKIKQLQEAELYVPSLVVPSIIKNKDLVDYQNHSSTWTLNGAAYSGQVESFYADGSIKQRFGVVKGLKQGESLDWFQDGHLKFAAHYHQGRLHGEKKVWYEGPEHHLASQLYYQKGKLHGQQKKWYVTGEIFKKLNLHMGKEDGLQQAFRKNGVLYANYEAKKGRTFGLKRASLCFELENENLVYGK